MVDHDGHFAGYSVVRHCTPRDGSFFVGLQLNEEYRQTTVLPAENADDYYEFLQISPKAEPATIQRVYRFLAGRYHPDNPETGDPEQFLLLNCAFAVLSDPVRRADYDARRDTGLQPIPAFESVDFMDGMEGEVNRRLAVLSLLYRRCRANVENPKVSLAEMEALMGFPREYLDFTTWYLKSKKYITREDNSDFTLTVLGVDYVEENYDRLPVLRKLLNAGSRERSEAESQSVEEPRFRDGDILNAGPATGLSVLE
jgi:curved DNA-binding protein CbpA